MHIRWVPPSGQFAGNTGRKTVSPHFPPWSDVQADQFLFWVAVDMDAPYREGYRLSVELVNVGCCLTYGDLALDSCTQFLAVAEHRVIPS